MGSVQEDEAKENPPRPHQKGNDETKKKTSTLLGSHRELDCRSDRDSEWTKMQVKPSTNTEANDSWRAKQMCQKREQVSKLWQDRGAKNLDGNCSAGTVVAMWRRRAQVQPSDR
jgi:hypothetical protein